ncbi:MAG: carbohydrate ABC transporter permease [Acidimicrobiales bacterium]
MVTAVCALVAIYILMPIYWMVIAALKSNRSLLNTFGFAPPAHIQLFSNIASLFTYQGGLYGRWLVDTAIYAVIAGVFAMLLATMAGYAFSRYHFRGRRAMFGLVVGSVMVPNTILVIPLYLMYSKLGLLDTALGFILPSMVSPIGVYLMKIYTESAVPEQLIDAARVDGAGEFRVFRSIVTPLVVPGAITVLLFSVVGTWNNYFLPLLIFSTERRMPVTVGLGILQQQANVGSSGAAQLYTMIVTGGLIAMIPLVVVFLVLQRYWTSGLSFGSLSG